VSVADRASGCCQLTAPLESMDAAAADRP
jgi:hypothetical protein